jgi:hypothetical protein
MGFVPTATQIDDGTAQIMKLVISRQKLGRELAP